MIIETKESVKNKVLAQMSKMLDHYHESYGVALEQLSRVYQRLDSQQKSDV